jgi:hypothetical protein
MKSALYLTIHRKWFEQIASGEKKIEYRAKTPFWERRLARQYEEVHFRNGYWPNAPFMRVEFCGLEQGADNFAIKLGRVLELRNWPCPKQQQQSRLKSLPS